MVQRTLTISIEILIKCEIGVFVLLHRDTNQHASKSGFEVLAPHEIMSTTGEERFELKWVGVSKHRTVRAARESYLGLGLKIAHWKQI